MKQYKKIIAAVAAAAILALPLSGCSFNDVMLYLYGGDSFTKEEGEDYQTYDGENGISVTYDANIWNELLSFYKYPLMQYVLTIILSLVWISLKGIFISVWYKVWYSSYKKCGTSPACKNK